MPITRLNHAVLYVRDVERSVAFYTDVLGFRVLNVRPTDSAAPPSCRRRGRPTTTTSGCSRSGRTRRPHRRGGAGPWGSTTWPGRSTRWRSWSGSRPGCRRRGALVGASDHGTTKSLYGKDPDGLEFEIAWIVPADQIDDGAVEARKRIGRLDLTAELARYGAETRGGVGISH